MKTQTALRKQKETESDKENRLRMSEMTTGKFDQPWNTAFSHSPFFFTIYFIPFFGCTNITGKKVYHAVCNSKWNRNATKLCLTRTTKGIVNRLYNYHFGRFAFLFVRNFMKPTNKRVLATDVESELNERKKHIRWLSLKKWAINDKQSTIKIIIWFLASHFLAFFVIHFASDGDKYGHFHALCTMTTYSLASSFALVRIIFH